MIHVDRPSLADRPALLVHFTEGRKLLSDFLSLPPERRAQRRAPSILQGSAWRDVVAALYDVFSGKCAYCESAIEASQPTVDRFWPQAAYPDRTFDWDNLYLCCTTCNLYKAGRFPLVHHGATRGEVAPSATPLLLDPCVEDPALSLQFSPDGTVSALSPSGETTIKTLALNRPDLVSRRHRRALETEAACDALWQKVEEFGIEPREFLDRVEDIVGNIDATHLAVVRAVAHQFLSERDHLPTVVPPPPKANEPAPCPVTAPARWLRSVHILNFKAINKLTLNFASPQNNRQPWLMLLGENGVGKNTVLEAVALAMTKGAGLKRPARDWLRPGSRRGHIRLSWDDGSPDFILHFSRDSVQFEFEGPPPDMPILAYGATRLLPPETEAPSPLRRPRNVGNLFDPLLPLAPVQAYLCNRKTVSQDAFDRLAYSLIQLLDLDERRDTIVRGRKTLRARLGAKETAFDNLSGGRKSILALAMDIMFNLASADGELRHAEGLVLLDEIELHLHPRWKVKIAKLLRHLFPTVRFIVTTHDPLCANGLDEGELNILFEQPDSHQRATQQLSIPPGTRTDDILTGPWFGLQSTMDEDTWNKMNEHSDLLQNRHRDAAAEHRMHELEGELRERLGGYGDTQVQRAALAVSAMLRDTLPQSRADQIGRARLRAVLANKDGAD